MTPFLCRLEVASSSSLEFIDITPRILQAIREWDLREGIVVATTPHTTAGVTINENADPDVRRDLAAFFQQSVPAEPYFRHGEGNSPAHILSSLVGASETLIVHEGRLVLGTWQAVYFCEFDGPRRRTVHLKGLAG
ncbi:MAG TPA: secondary thiamine-phosphate synthase enzyme YjbQ [Candidatus Aminicenantes bacterium]|nr:secondary thiamine-phosphate synthase enzyme YjbQ [Candidatus Aminicenantes bacterium]